MAELPDLPAGIYRHWKGHLYLVLGYASDSGNGSTVVVYVGLELEDARPGPRMHVRAADDFFASVETAGGIVPRFLYLAPGLPGD